MSRASSSSRVSTGRSREATCPPCLAHSLTTSNGTRPRACHTGACTAAARPSRRNVFGPIAEDVEGFAVVPEEFIGAGETVAAVVRYQGTGKVTGKPLDLPVVHLWDIRDGKLARFRQFIDTVKFAEVVPVSAAV